MNPNSYNNGWMNTGYNNVSNVGYQQPPIYPVQQKGITTVAIISGGYQSAESYPVAAGNTAVLIDFNLGKFWLKTTDIYGRPLLMEEYNFFKPTNTQSPTQEPIQQNQNDYVKKEDFNIVAAMVSELYKELKGDTNNVQPK